MLRYLFLNRVWGSRKVSVWWCVARRQSLTHDAGMGVGVGAGAGEEVPELPEEPTDCCMSGCANCVWIAYAEQLSQLYKDGGQRAKDAIASKVTDPSMKMFLLMELKALEEEKNS